MGFVFHKKIYKKKKFCPPPPKKNYVALNETWATQYFSIFFMQL